MKNYTKPMLEVLNLTADESLAVNISQGENEVVDNDDLSV